jgi:hypothetical protein
MTYINPFFSEYDDPNEAIPLCDENGRPKPNPLIKSTSEYESTTCRRNLFREGIKHGYFVKTVTGAPYTLHSGSIEFHMLDCTNPYAQKWMKDIIKHELIYEASSSGWMADFGEYLPFDSVLYSEQSAAEYHNLYPHDWVKLNEEAVLEAKAEGLIFKALNSSKPYNTSANATSVNSTTTKTSIPKVSSFAATTEKFTASLRDVSSRYGMGKRKPKIPEVSVDAETDFLYMIRSAWLKTPSHTSVFWLGDQLVSWDIYDGLKSALIGFLSGGISGHTLAHSDIGGYTMVS